MLSDSQRFMSDLAGRAMNSGTREDIRTASVWTVRWAVVVTAFITMKVGRDAMDWDLERRIRRSPLSSQDEEQQFHRLCTYFSFKAIFLLCSMVDSPQCFLFLHQSDSPTDHLFLGSQVSLILTYISNYVYDDRARSYISLRRISPMALPSPSPGHSLVVTLLICATIVAPPLTLMAVSLPWRL